jgi:hypothetical protein
MLVYAKRRGSILMKCEGLVVVRDDYRFWDVMMFGLEGSYRLLEELAAAIFRLDVLGSSCTKRLYAALCPRRWECL